MAALHRVQQPQILKDMGSLKCLFKMLKNNFCKLSEFLRMLCLGLSALVVKIRPNLSMDKYDGASTSKR